jgi:hypothetical protein
VARGASAYRQGSGYTSNDIEKTVGEFWGQAGHEYQLEVTVLRSLRVLEAAKPRMHVQLHPINTKGDPSPALLYSTSIGHVVSTTSQGQAGWRECIPARNWINLSVISRTRCRPSLADHNRASWN